MTCFPNDKIKYRYNEEKDKTFSPFGDLVGIQDVIINGKLYEDGDDILVKDSFESKWILGKFCYAHDNEVYAITEYNRNPISWRYAASPPDKIVASDNKIAVLLLKI